MKKSSQSDLTARINKFMDRKLAKTTKVSDFGSFTSQRSQRRMTDFDSQYIALAIK